jgi:hypothetical protein
MYGVGRASAASQGRTASDRTRETLDLKVPPTPDCGTDAPHFGYDCETYNTPSPRRDRARALSVTVERALFQSDNQESCAPLAWHPASIGARDLWELEHGRRVRPLRRRLLRIPIGRSLSLRHQLSAEKNPWPCHHPGLEYDKSMSSLLFWPPRSESRDNKWILNIFG